MDVLPPCNVKCIPNCDVPNFFLFIVVVVLNMDTATGCLLSSVNAGFCTVCAQYGRQSKLQLCRLNSKEALYICLYPEVSFT